MKILTLIIEKIIPGMTKIEAESLEMLLQKTGIF